MSSSVTGVLTASAPGWAREARGHERCVDWPGHHQEPSRTPPLPSPQDLLQLQYEGVAVMKLFNKAKVNVNLLIFLLNKKLLRK